MIFSSKTETNGRTEVLSTEDLQGLKVYGSNRILTHKGEMYKSLKSYWLTKPQLVELRSTHEVHKSDF